MILASFFMMVTMVSVASYIAVDSRKRGMSMLSRMAFMGAVMVLPFMGVGVAPFLVIPVYLMTRPKPPGLPGHDQAKTQQNGPTQLCPKCGHDAPLGASHCPACGNALTLS